MEKKIKIIRLLVGFLIFMFVCTIVSRSVYTYQMPQVKAGNADARSISHKVQAQGVLTKKSSSDIQSEKAVVAAPDLRVEKIYVKKGDKVKAGSELFEVDEKDVKKKIKEFEEQKRDASEKISQLTKDKNKAEEQKAKDKRNMEQQAQEEIREVEKEQNTLVSEAKKEYEEAKEDLKKYPDWKTYLQNEINCSSEYLTMQETASKKGVTQEDKDAFRIFTSTFEASAKKAWQEGKTTLEDALKQAKGKWQSAKSTRDSEVKKIKNTKQREQQGTDTEDNDISDEVKEQQKIIEQAQEEAEKYYEIQRKGCAVKSDYAGTIQAVSVSVGEVTSDGASVVLSDVKQSWNFVADLSEDEKQYVKVGDKVDITFSDENIEWNQMEISEIKRNSDGIYQAIIPVNKKKIKEMSGIMQIDADSENKECCVPLSALYANGTENYVLVIQEKNTFLGKEYTVEKRKVSVEDKNGEYAALNNSPLSNEEHIVTLSDREVKPGQKVRMMEEENE